MHEIEIRSGVVRPIECAKEAFELIKSDYWLLFAIWIVGAMIGGVTLMIAGGAMTAGTFYAYLRKVDGEKANFDDLWKGMQWFLPGLIVVILIVLPMILIYALIYVPILIAAMMGPKANQSDLLAMLFGSLVVDLILVVIMVCFHTLLTFCFPIIVDQNVGAVKAISLSARAVFKNLGGVTGLIGVNFVLVLVGYLALCVGVYLVIPVIIATNVVAYRKIFPKPNNVQFQPPPPSVYGGGIT